MSTAAGGKSALSGILSVTGCSRGSLGGWGLTAVVCLPSRTGSGTRCPSPTAMGVPCSIPLSKCSWLPWGSHQPSFQGQLRGTGCSQAVLSPREGMEPEAGRCWAGSSLGTHGEWAGMAEHGATRAIQPHRHGQQPHPMAQVSSTGSGDRGVTPVPAGWDHHQPRCVSSLGIVHVVVVTLIAQTRSGVGLCPAHISANLGRCQSRWKGLWGVCADGHLRACRTPSVPSSATGMDTL